MAGETDKAEPTRKFKTIFSVVASSGSAEAGGTIALTKAEFDELKALGAIEGEWKETAAKA